MRVDQFYKLRDTDTDDLLEVYCILNDITEEQKNKLLTKSFKKLASLCNKIDIPNLDFTKLDKPKYIKIGNWIYHVPKDFTELTYDQYLQIGGVLSDLNDKAKDLFTDKWDIANYIEQESINIIPDVVAIVFKCDRDKVLKSEARKVFPLGAFFLRSISDYTKLKAKLKEQSLMKMQSKPVYYSSTNTSTTIKS